MNRKPSRECPPADVLYGFIDGVLDRAATERWQRHVEACPECSAAVREAESLRQLGKSVGASAKREENEARVNRWTRQTLADARTPSDNAESTNG